MSVPLSIFLVRYGVKVGEGNDVAAVRAQPLLIKATFPVLQLALVFIGDPDVGVIIIHAHPSHSGVVTLQELVVHLLVMLRKTDEFIRTVRNYADGTQRASVRAVTTKLYEATGELRWCECDRQLCRQLGAAIQTENHTIAQGAKTRRGSFSVPSQ